MIRYADDFVVLLRGTKAQAEALRGEVAGLLREQLRMELSLEKTRVPHVDEGFDFLGHTARRRPYNGSLVCMTYPSKKSLNAIKDRVRTLTPRSTRNQSLRVLLMQLSPVLRGWSTYFRDDAAKRCLAYVDHFAWQRVFRWLRKKHPKRTVQYLRQRNCDGRWRINDGGIELFRPSKVRVERYCFRGTRIYPAFAEPEEGAKVGRYARSSYDDPERMGWLGESLARP
jgi:RNA-directed DNA polymerase